MLDLVIADATIVDGSGGAPSRGSVGIAGDAIAWIGVGEHPAAARVVDGRGRALAPGFVDVHNHSDLSPLILPTMPSTIRQGVTAVVVGNCGSSPWPLTAFEEAVRLAYGDPADVARPEWNSYGDYLDALGAARPAVNVATLIGHGSVRREVLGPAQRAPNDEELATMRGIVADAIEAGAVGLSTGLIYVPGIYSATEEVVALAAEAGRRGGLYASHIRGEGAHLFRALDEALEIGRRARVPVHVSHLKCESSIVWGRAGELLQRVHAAEDATGDQYPYAAWNSSLASLLPPWAVVDELAALRSDPRLRVAVEEGEPDFQSSVDGVGWDRIVVVDGPDARWRGTSVASIAEQLGVDPFDACCDLLLQDPETSCIGHAMREDDVAMILADPEVFVASDASATAPDGPGGDLPVHPRDYGTFARALALVREGPRSLPEMIRKMTSLPAERFGLAGRGRIVDGGFADLVLFDAGAIRDSATYEAPHAFPEGIEMVVVNGVVAWEPGAEIARAGRVLRRR